MHIICPLISYFYLEAACLRPKFAFLSFSLDSCLESGGAITVVLGLNLSSRSSQTLPVYGSVVLFGPRILLHRYWSPEP